MYGVEDPNLRNTLMAIFPIMFLKQNESDLDPSTNRTPTINNPFHRKRCLDGRW